eukprot:12373782-Ditylum_brightwellii.AAC.1
MQALTVSTLTDSNSPAGIGHQTTREKAVFLSKAAKQMDEWEESAKACAKERKELEKEISAALDMLNKATKKTQKNSVASKNAQLLEKTMDMDSMSTELEEWHITFDADQQKWFWEQDKKMTKNVDAQSNKFDNKIDSLAMSVQHQLTTNQSNIQQLLQEQLNYLDSTLTLLLESIKNMPSTVDKHSKQIKSMQTHIDDTSCSPHNKQQKHSNDATAEADVMENVDALQVNRDTPAPDPGGMGAG